MLITADHPFKNPSIFNSIIIPEQRAPSYAFPRSHCPSHNSPAPLSPSSSPVTRQHSILESGVRPSVMDTNIIMDEPWQQIKIHYDNDALGIDYEPDDDIFDPVWENPRIESLRRDKDPGVAPPYCATAPALFPRNTHPNDIKLGQKLRSHKPTPLRNIALSNVPKQPLTGALEHSPVLWLLRLARLGALYIVDGLRRAWTELPFRSSCPVWHSTTGLTSNKQFTMNGAESTKRHWAGMSKGNGPIQVV